MGLYNEPTFLDWVGVIFLFVGVIGSYFKWCYTYWEKKHVPCIETCFRYEITDKLFFRKKSLGIILKQSYDELKSQNYKYGGIYTISSPVYLPIHPELVKNIMQSEGEFFFGGEDDLVCANLIGAGGEKWKDLRTRLISAFTTENMQLIVDSVIQSSLTLMDTRKNNEVDIKEIVARFTGDIFGFCTFGSDCNCFKKEESEFENRIKILEPTNFEHVSHLSFPTCLYAVGSCMRHRRKAATENTEAFVEIVKDVVNYRETNSCTRKDMLQILIDLKNEKVDKDVDTTLTAKSTTEEIALQALVFFLRGFETSSITMTYCLYELASNVKIQQKVRDEINLVLTKYNGNITYEAISEMNYMTQVVEETLRKYPPIPQIKRKCVKDYPVPGTSLVLERGISVYIPVLGLHYDPQFYPNPDKFDPDRFTKEKKRARHPFCYIPFGQGPRICIGLRFGMMQIKVGLTILLRRFEYSVNYNTKLPLEIDPDKNLLSTLGPIWLNVKTVN